MMERWDLNFVQLIQYSITRSEISFRYLKAFGE